jgi:hypothetical protein
MFYIYEILGKTRTPYRLLKDNDLIRKGVMYNILIKSHSYMKVVRLLKMASCLVYRLCNIHDVHDGELTHHYVLKI